MPQNCAKRQIFWPEVFIVCFLDILWDHPLNHMVTGVSRRTPRYRYRYIKQRCSRLRTRPRFWKLPRDFRFWPAGRKRHFPAGPKLHINHLPTLTCQSPRARVSQHRGSHLRTNHQFNYLNNTLPAHSTSKTHNLTSSNLDSQQ